jgi:hypothetical protein
MNDDRGEVAAGFKLDFLPRLAQTKGSDKKTTALDLVVMIFITGNKREGLALSSDFPDCQEASRMQISDLMTDVRNLEGSLRKCRKELEELQKEYEASQKGKPPPITSKVPIDSRSEAALGSRLTGPSSFDTKSDIPGQRSGAQKSTAKETGSLSPRAALIASMQEKNDDKMEFTLDASIRRLEKFISEADYVHLPKLQAERKNAIDACKDLASFFCEPGGEKTASNLLKILAEFAAGIDSAVVKYDELQKAEARKKASKKRKSLTGSKPPVPETYANSKQSLVSVEKIRPVPEMPSVARQYSEEEPSEKKSLVLMVNEMLKMAGDKQIQDFVEGKVIENPDDRLKKIYEAEKTRVANQRDILSAIRERSNSRRDSNMHEALSGLHAKLIDSKSGVESDLYAESDPSFSKTSIGRIAQRWSSNDTASLCKEDDKLSEISVSLAENRRKSRVAERWSRKAENDRFSDIISENEDPMEKTDSEILSYLSNETSDVKYQRRKRQSYMERWASRNATVEAKDVDEESDVGAFEAMLNNQRKKAIDRWARKPSDEEILE